MINGFLFFAEMQRIQVEAHFQKCRIAKIRVPQS